MNESEHETQRARRVVPRVFQSPEGQRRLDINKPTRKGTRKATTRGIKDESRSSFGRHVEGVGKGCVCAR